MSQPLYSIGTWDMELQAYSPQPGLTVPSINIGIGTLTQAMRELRKRGYSCHRYRDEDGGHDDNDWAVLIERTDGKPESEIMENWKR